MKAAHLMNLTSVVPVDQAVTVWLTSGEKLTGTGYTYDVKGIAQLMQTNASPIVIDLDHVAAVQSTPPAGA